MRILFFLIAIFATHTLFSEKGSQDSSTIFLLPLDASEDFCVLGIEMPKSFMPLGSIEKFARQEGTMIQYIPQEEKSSEWGEMITLNKCIGRGIQAKKFSQIFKEELSKRVQEVKIISSDSSKENLIEKAHFIAHYMNQNEKEVLGALYFSGPYDFAAVQYTIRLKNTQTVADATKKIELFFKNNVQVITSD